MVGMSQTLRVTVFFSSSVCRLSSLRPLPSKSLLGKQLGRTTMSVSFSPRESRQVKYRIGFGFVAAILAAAAALGCKGAPEAKKSKSVEVVVAQPVLSEVTDYQDFTGRMDALKTVDIRPRVSGYITEAPFVEGDIVREGDLLFQIDPRPYQAEVNLKLAQADVSLQTKRARRGMELVQQGSGAIGPEDYDQLVAALEKAR